MPSKRVSTTCEHRAIYGILVTLLFLYKYEYIVMGVFLSFEGTYIKLYFVEGWNVNNPFFEDTVFYIKELTFLKVLEF